MLLLKNGMLLHGRDRREEEESRCSKQIEQPGGVTARRERRGERTK
jgi:hypothetical protein